MPTVPGLDNPWSVGVENPGTSVSAPTVPKTKYGPEGVAANVQTGTQGLLEGVSAAVEKYADYMDKVRVQEAVLQLQDRMMHRQYDKDTGWNNLYGKTALDVDANGRSLSQVQDEANRKDMQELSSKLTARQRRQFGVLGGRMCVQNSAAVLNHMAQQGYVYKKQVYDQGVKQALTKAQLAKDGTEFADAVGQLDAVTSQAAKELGIEKDPQIMSGVYAAKIDQLRESGDLVGAQVLAEQAAPYLTQKDSESVQKGLRYSEADAKAQKIATEIVNRPDENGNQRDWDVICGDALAYAEAHPGAEGKSVLAHVQAQVQVLRSRLEREKRDARDAALVFVLKGQHPPESLRGPLDDGEWARILDAADRNAKQAAREARAEARAREADRKARAVGGSGTGYSGGSFQNALGEKHLSAPQASLVNFYSAMQLQDPEGFANRDLFSDAGFADLPVKLQFRFAKEQRALRDKQEGAAQKEANNFVSESVALAPAAEYGVKLKSGSSELAEFKLAAKDAYMEAYENNGRKLLTDQQRQGLRRTLFGKWDDRSSKWRQGNGGLGYETMRDKAKYAVDEKGNSRADSLRVQVSQSEVDAAGEQLRLPANRRRVSISVLGVPVAPIASPTYEQAYAAIASGQAMPLPYAMRRQGKAQVEAYFRQPASEISPKMLQLKRTRGIAYLAQEQTKALIYGVKTPFSKF